MYSNTQAHENIRAYTLYVHAHTQYSTHTRAGQRTHVLTHTQRWEAVRRDDVSCTWNGYTDVGERSPRVRNKNEIKRTRGGITLRLSRVHRHTASGYTHDSVFYTGTTAAAASASRAHSYTHHTDVCIIYILYIICIYTIHTRKPIIIHSYNKLTYML